MTCQALICVVDQRTPRKKGDHYRPGKHRPGQIICIRDLPTKWGRMEGPLGQSMILEVNANARDLQIYTDEASDQPILDWNQHNNHMRCTVTFPRPLEEHEYEWLNMRFSRWTVNVSPYHSVFDLRTDLEIVSFDQIFAREYRDKLLKSDGPRFVMNEPYCQQIAVFENGFSRCSLGEFKENVIDRAVERFGLAA